MRNRMLALLLALALGLGLAACGTGKLPPAESGTAPQTEAPEAARTTELEAAEETVPATETEAVSESAPPSETAAPEPVETEPPAEPAPGPSDSSAHVYPEDPWGLVYSMRLEYTDPLGEKGWVEFPYLHEEDYLEEENMYVSYGYYGGIGEMNEDIAEIASAIARTEAGSGGTVYALNYEVHAWEDVLAIVLSWYDKTAENCYRVYLIDTSDQFRRLLSTAELLERMGISQEYFLETCKRQRLEAFLADYDNSAIRENAAEEFQLALGLAESGEGISLELQAYPDENGQLYVIVPYLSMVGAGSYDGVLEMEMPGSD